MNFTAIQKRIWRRSKTNSTSYPIADLTDDVNVALDHVVSLIMQVDGRWQFDDENQTDLPIATTDIVAGQQDYSLLVAHLEVTRVEMLGPDGKWHLLTPSDQTDVHDRALSEIATDGRIPRSYDKIANSIILDRAPTFSQPGGLKVWFKRGPSYFVSSDTTKTPGYNPLYHDLLVLWPVYEKLSDNELDGADRVMVQIEGKEAALTASYSRRSKEPIRVTPRTHSSR
jgi:hypothetical protein